MFRVALTPRWLALHLLLAVVVVGFIRLGMWQFDSYRAQQDDGRAATPAATPLPLGDVVRPGQQLAHDAVAVLATGRYDADQQLLIAGVRQGGRRGYAVATPLRLDDGSVLVVLRGWTPTASAAVREVPAGDVEVTGVIGPNDPDIGIRSDETTPAGHVITAGSTEELLRLLPYRPDLVYDGRVVLTSQVPAASGGLELLPVRRHHRGVSAWRNLAYALQWWFFAAAAVVLWFVSLRGAAAKPAESRQNG